MEGRDVVCDGGGGLRNIVVRGIKGREEEMKKKVEKLVEEWKISAKLEEVKVVKGRGEGRESVVVKLGNEEQKKEIMRSKSKLKGKEI